ncbi:hypothetical protein [Micromonospora carbonacea]|uniref:hypothetical protein n=1 Tax=Micromonospora carbonacea TaxID=47853 RepID=UPI0037196990
MNLDTNSVTSFSPTDPDLWEVTFTGEVDTWTMPVIGFAVVVTYAGEDGVPSDTRTYPVVLDDSGMPVHVFEYLQEWKAPHPDFKLHRKPPASTVCPACGKPTVYAPTIDRHLHQDGTDNQPCWRQIVRGQAT